MHISNIIKKNILSKLDQLYEALLKELHKKRVSLDSQQFAKIDQIRNATFFQGTRDINRLDIMSYIDPTSNSRSTPQMLSDKNGKSCTW